MQYFSRWRILKWTSFILQRNVIINFSLEDHCSLPQQAVMAHIFQEEFGDMLLTAPVGESEVDKNDLPSPEQLRGKIILKVRNV